MMSAAHTTPSLPIVTMTLANGQQVRRAAGKSGNFRFTSCLSLLLRWLLRSMHRVTISLKSLCRSRTLGGAESISTPRRF